jgi:dihydrofolate reductase
VKAIVAVDKNWGIGKENHLLFNIPEDMRHFKEKTLGKIVLMGKQTFLSLPNASPLKGRENWVLSTSLSCLGCRVFNTIDEVIDAIRNEQKDIFLIGGGKLYYALIDYCDEAYITKINADGQADCFFPNLDARNNWYSEGRSQVIQSKDLEISFTIYKNKSPLF